MSGMQWFRTYASIVDDEKLRLLAFEDRWHFLAICALKCSGLLDEAEGDLKLRKVAIKLGVQLRELDEIRRRLLEVGLIDENFQPLAWEKRQYRKGDLPDGESLDGHKGYVYFIADAELSAVKIGYSKNPWARVKEFQTGHPQKLSVVATVKTTEISEVRLHDLFEAERTAGEWFSPSPRIHSVLKGIRAKKLKTVDDVVSYVAGYVAPTITTTETETESEEELEPNGSCASDDALKPDHVFDFWNEDIAPLGKKAVRSRSPERRQLVRARLREHDLPTFQEVFANIRGSPFLLDAGGIQFDWVMQKKNFTKILEGNYNG